MPRPALRRVTMALCAASCVLLASCGGGSETAGNTVEMRDMDVVDGTVNDSMTDLDAVTANGVGTGNHASNASSSTRPAAPRETVEEENADAETVAAE